MSKFIDLSGRRFGRLVAIEHIKSEKQGTFWKCKCDCGTEYITTSSHLLNGYTKSCGCLKKSQENELAGTRFGYWTVLSKAQTRNGISYWNCRCDCGNERKVSTCNLITGKSKSCGCYQKQVLKQRTFKHGMTNSRLYTIYNDMKHRTQNPNDPAFKHYGKRGITICDEWLGEDGFSNFVEWSINNGYSDDLSIDRIEVNGNYCPENCRWATSEVQGNNKRVCHYITHNGETHTVTEWSKITGIKRETLFARIRYGWDESQLFNPPPRRKRS